MKLPTTDVCGLNIAHCLNSLYTAEKKLTIVLEQYTAVDVYTKKQVEALDLYTSQIICIHTAIKALGGTPNYIL